MAVGIREVFEVFERVVALPPGQRESALAQACRGDELLYAEARRVLSGHDLVMQAQSASNAVQDAECVHDAPNVTRGKEPPGNQSEVRFCADDRSVPPEVPDFWRARKIGEGGFGTVWLARNTLTKQWCAVKVISATHESEIRGIEEFIAAIRGSPYFMPVHHVGRVGAAVYVVMPKADDAAGGDFDHDRYTPYTLETRLRQGVIPAREAARIGADLATALTLMHGRNICHGDIKPANILRFEGRWVVADFGLVSRLDGEASRGFSKDYVVEGVVDKRIADLIALARTLYRLATRDSATGISSLIENPQRLGASGYSRRLADTIRKAHEQKAPDAIHSADAMRRALEQAARPAWLRPVLTLGAVLAVAAATFGILRTPPPPFDPAARVEVFPRGVSSETGREVPLDSDLWLGDPGVVVRERDWVKLHATIGEARWAAVIPCLPNGELGEPERFGGRGLPIPVTSAFGYPPSKDGKYRLTDGPGRYGFLVVYAGGTEPPEGWFESATASWNKEAKQYWTTPNLPDMWLFRDQLRPVSSQRGEDTQPAVNHPLRALADAVSRAIDPTGKLPPEVCAVMFVASPPKPPDAAGGKRGQ